MKRTRIIIGIMMVLVMSFVLPSCEEENPEPVIIPSINVPQTEFNVGFKAGEIPIDFTSNVIFYANADAASKTWLSCQFRDTCNTLNILYAESDTTAVRTGTVILSKGDSTVVITVTQAGNPDAGLGLQKVEIEYTISTGGGLTVLRTTPEESAKIPVGATLVFKCAADIGTIQCLSSTYVPYAQGSPVGGEVKFVWTQSMADITAASGIMAILRDGVEVTDLYGLFNRRPIEYNITTAGGFTVLRTTPEASAKIPVGAVVVFECPVDIGTIQCLSSTYVPYASGSPVNGKYAFIWTQEIADITAASGIMAILRDGVNVTNMYYIAVRTDIEYSVTTAGGFTILRAAVEEAHKIPIGATVVFECPADVGTVQCLSSTYVPYAQGSPVNGKFTFTWTTEMVTITATSGIMAILRDGVEVSDLYSHN